VGAVFAQIGLIKLCAEGVTAARAAADALICDGAGWRRIT